MSSAFDHHERVRRQFGPAAGDYVTARSFASGRDLDILSVWAEGGPSKRLLDVATGGGHTALALSRSYGTVVASDLTADMLRAAQTFAAAQGSTNVTFAIADAEALPFQDRSFDAVSCRIAPHHFPRPDRFVSESYRVLRADGILLLEDSISPEDEDAERLLNHFERLRDPTHVRSLRRHEWLTLLRDAGFVLEEEALDRKHHPLAEYMDRSRTPESTRREIYELLAGASATFQDRLGLTFDSSGRCTSFTDEKLLLKARKPRI